MIILLCVYCKHSSLIIQSDSVDPKDSSIIRFSSIYVYGSKIFQMFHVMHLHKCIRTIFFCVSGIKHINAWSQKENIGFFRRETA